MTKTLGDNCDINIVQQTSCEPLFPVVQMQMYFFVPSVQPYMHLNYVVISGRYSSRDCVWLIILVAGLSHNLPWAASVSSHQVQCNIVPLRPFYKKICTCTLKDAESLATYACALWCSQIVYIRPYSLNTTTAFYFVTEGSNVTVLSWACVLATTHFYFNWPWPGLDTYHPIFVTYPGCNVVPSVTS